MTTIDSENLSKKMKLKLILDSLFNEANNTDLLLGAGISFNSGLPLAIPLLKKILLTLGIETSDIDIFISKDWELALPFEGFFETFLENVDDKSILDIFKLGDPNTNHFLVSSLILDSKISSVYTTNFDLLLERAFEINSQKLNKIYLEQDYINISDENSILCKLHGCISDIHSLRTTLNTITNKNLSKHRIKLIDKVFKKNKANNLLIMGYSCSDIFDITPRIEQIKTSEKNIIFIKHKSSAINASKVDIKKLSLTSNLFKNYNGFEISINTDFFVQKVYEFLKIDIPINKISKPLWEPMVNEWVTSINPYLRYNILAQLFYKLSNYEKTIEYYNKSIISNPDQNRSKGAAFSNISLVYNALGNHTEAIAKQNEALKIFENINLKTGIFASYNNIALFNIHLSAYNTATKYLIMANRFLRFNEFDEKLKCLSDLFCNQGFRYEKVEKFETAIYFYEKALEIDKTGNKIGECTTHYDLGRAYKKMKNIRKSKKHFKYSLEIAIKLTLSEMIEKCKSEIKCF